MSKPSQIISVQNLVKRYGNNIILKEVNFEVGAGEIFGIVGPNGAGKTTILEIIETLTPKTSGQITVGGYNLDFESEKIRKIIGIQLQSGGFYPDLNLKELLYLFADLYNVKIQPIDFLKQVNLEDKANHKIDELSGGQKQRFSIVSTLVADPAIIFLDEPTTGLDPQARHNLWLVIKELKQKGKTIVLTTHYMEEAEYLCDKVAIIDKGIILQIDTPFNLINQLINRGFNKDMTKLQANLEDVFLDLTGKQLRD